MKLHFLNYLALPRHFGACSQNNVQAMLGQVITMRRILYMLACEDIPSATYSVEELQSYMQSLICRQHGAAGYWSVAPNVEALTPLHYYAFVFIPSCIAISLMSMYLQCLPGSAIQITRFAHTLRAGMKFCTSYYLMPDYFDNDLENVFRAKDIFSMGDIYRLADVNPALCPGMKRVWKKGKVKSGSLLELFRMVAEDRKTIWDPDAVDLVANLVAFLELPSGA